MKVDAINYVPLTYVAGFSINTSNESASTFESDNSSEVEYQQIAFKLYNIRPTRFIIK